MNHKAIIRITPELFNQLIGFPVDAHLLHAEWNGLYLQVVMAHPDLPECQDGAIPQTVNPVVGMVAAKEGDMIPKIMDWGVK
jgi:hypothetical protein